MISCGHPLHPVPDPHRRLLNALEAADLDAARQALLDGASPRVPLANNGMCALHCLGTLAPAWRDSDVRAMSALLFAHGAMAAQTWTLKRENGSDDGEPMSPMFAHLLQSHRSASFVRALLEQGADPNEIMGTPPFMERPLHQAMMFAHSSPARLGILQALIEFGADPNLTNHESLSALQVLLRDPGYPGDGELLTNLLDAGADPLLEKGPQPCAETMAREWADRHGDKAVFNEQGHKQVLLWPVLQVWRDTQSLRRTLQELQAQGEQAVHVNTANVLPGLDARRRL